MCCQDRVPWQPGQRKSLALTWTLTWQEGASAGAPKPPWPFSGAFPPMNPSSQELSDCGVQFLPSKGSRHCKHARMCAHVHTHTHTSVHTHTCMSVHTGTCTQPLTCMRTHSTWARTQHPCMHVSVQVHTQAHARTCTRSLHLPFLPWSSPCSLLQHWVRRCFLLPLWRIGSARFCSHIWHWHSLSPHK